MPYKTNEEHAECLYCTAEHERLATTQRISQEEDED
jgi:hypothetical protein